MTALSPDLSAPPGKSRPPERRDPAWRGRLAGAVVALLLLWPMLVLTEFKPWLLLAPDALTPSLRFLADFVPPRLDAEFLALVARETWRTVAIATAGLTLALVLAVPLALLSVRVLSISALTGPMAPLPALVRLVVRWLLVVLRSVPELIWALVFVRVVGLGPTAGVLAIALTFAGMLGKVYAEILDSAELTSYTVYRWECAIRSSAVLGFVGAGGLGQQMDASMKMFEGAEVATMLLVFMALVWLADSISAWLRQRLA